MRNTASNTCLTRDIKFEHIYKNSNNDGAPDIITARTTVNDTKVEDVVNDITQATRTITSPEGRTATQSYDRDTLLTYQLSIPGLLDTQYYYDNKGRLTSQQTSTRQISLTYNAQGFVDSLTDPNHQTTRFAYDAVGQVTGVQRPDGSSLGFSYDPDGHMTVLTNPVDVNHTFTCNHANLLSGYRAPLSGNYSYVYDKDRNLIQTNFPSGRQINNIYTSGQLTQIQTPEKIIDLAYDCSSKIGSITKGDESINYAYDGKLLTDETFGGTLNQSIDYTYDNDFDVTSMTYAGGTEALSYDLDGLLTGSGSYTISRNAGNGMPEAVSGNGLSISRGFNGYGELASQDTSINGSSAISWNLTRDNAGRIATKTGTVGGQTHNYAYAYDAMGRLLTVTRDGAVVEQYGYDLSGTRTSETNTLRGITGRTFSYSDEDHLLTAGNTTYQYDPDGFLTTKNANGQIATYSYSSRGELLQVSLPDGRTINYVHDPLGRRIAKRINGVIVEKYLWLGLTKLLAVYDGSDNLIQRFEYADGRMPVAMTMAGVRYFLAYDQVGSLRAVTDGAGNIVKQIDYDSFGNVLADTNGSLTAPFGFAGGLYDKDTGLVRFGKRDYDPDTGRWTAKDPIRFAGGDTDLYGYVQNDPVNGIDPWGLWDLMSSLQALNAGWQADPKWYAYTQPPEAVKDLENMVVDEAAKETAQDLASKFIGPAAGSALEDFNFLIGILDPFPPSLNPLPEDYIGGT
jgi:RHS repeat-associated protein